MSDGDRGQVSSGAAEIYEEFFLPALFSEWPSRVIAEGDLRPGQKVLDVACGTGVLARAAYESVMPGGSVTGLDVNEGMLTVARQRAPHIDWREGAAEAMPLEDNSYDAVLSQFGLMFFEDPVAAVREMERVLQPGGTCAVAVWDSLENTPGYHAAVQLLRRLFGDDVASALEAPYNLGDKSALSAVFGAAGVSDLKVETYDGTARFPSIDSWMYTDVRGWTLADMIDDSQYELLLGEAKRSLSEFVTDEGAIMFKAPAHIATFRKATDSS